MPGILCCVAFFVAGYLAFEVAVYRFACLLCDMPRPGVIRSIGVVGLLLVAPALIDAVHMALLVEVYAATGYPLWEAGVVEFFLALPVHMFVCSVLHAKMTQITFRECLSVWMVEKLVKLVLVLGIGGMFAVLLLAAG